MKVLIAILCITPSSLILVLLAISSIVRIGRKRGWWK